MRRLQAIDQMAIVRRQVATLRLLLNVLPFEGLSPDRYCAASSSLRGLLLACCFWFLPLLAQANGEAKELQDMSLDELLQVKVSTGTLGGSERRKVPATVTTITQGDIDNSGARDLFELLEIHVPNLLYLRHSWEGSHIGLRGIISDRENKYLLIVNGKVMNELTHAGAVTERDLMTLGDIEEVRVVRGPGAAVYGAGAISGVIEIKTFDGKSFRGTEATIRAGAGEEFYTAEIKSGHQFTDNAHLFLYAGISQRQGADADDSPIITGISGQSFQGPIDSGTGLPLNGHRVVAGQPSPYAIDDKGEYRGLPPLKFHAQLTIGDLDIWARYTRGGEIQDWDHRALATHGFPWVTGTNGPGWWWIPFVFGFTNPIATLNRQAVGYQQFSTAADYRQPYAEDWEGNLRLSYDLTDFERQQMFAPSVLDAHREDKFTARWLTTWNTSENHALIVGTEYQHAEFGLSSPGFPDGGAIQGGQPMERWHTDTWSLLAEDRWDMTSHWSLFTDLRADKNNYTDWMFSPRVALVLTPTPRDTVKLILSQATKANFAEELRSDHVLLGEHGDTERLRAVELSYGRIFGEHWSVGLSTFFHDYKVIGYDNRSMVVGKEETVGVEGELAYQSGSFQAAVSHAFTTLLDFRDGSPGQTITAEPYGYGSDINHWAANMTKLRFAWQPVDKLRFTGSLRVFWGFPGSDDFRQYANAQYYSGNTGAFENFVTDPARYNPYDNIQLRLNLGVIYEFSKHFTVALHGYNLLGWVDRNFNNRLFVYSAQARSEAVGGALTLSCKF
jgi:iron complex outermembrane receptor protein